MARWKYVPMTDQELRELALKIVEGRVYGTWQVPSDLAGMVFMPLNFMTRRSLTTMKRRGMQHLYAVMGEDQLLGNRAINGYPVFASFRMLHRDDAARLWPLVKGAQEARHAFLGIAP